jgi:diadenylate cyclase
MLLLAQSILPNLPRLTVTSVIDILIVATLIYQFLMMIRGRRAAAILAGLVLLSGVYMVAVYAQFELLRTILAYLAPYTAFAVIVMFQSELRRILARIGRAQLLPGARLQRREVTQEILLAVTQMAGEKTGALIVIERDVGLRTFIESGVVVDASISRDLLCAIFQRGGPLHDGAAIIQRDRIAAAACFLPLSMNPQLMKELGTRHRAAIGITEEADCLSIIVSEERGQVSVAAFGDIETAVDMKRLEERLNAHARHREPRHLVAHPEPAATRREPDHPMDQEKAS